MEQKYFEYIAMQRETELTDWDTPEQPEKTLKKEQFAIAGVEDN